MARLIFLLLRYLGPPVVALIESRVFGRIPAAPFLELMPARTAIGRSLTMSILLAGVLGLGFYASLTAGAWVLATALAGVGLLAIGCSRAIASFWWPVALAGALLGLAIVLVMLGDLSPWATAIDPESQPVRMLAVGGLAVLALAVWSTVVTVLALRRLEEVGQRS